MTTDLGLHDPPVVVYMPLCRSPRGEPVCVLDPSRQYLVDDPHCRWRVVAEALEVFEMSRRGEHGSSMRLPTLDPGAWQLVLRTEPGHPVHSEQHSGRRRYDLVPV